MCRTTFGRRSLGGEAQGRDPARRRDGAGSHCRVRRYPRLVGAAKAAPTMGRSAEASPGPVYDPSETQFSALLTFGGMRVIAPGIYGDFLSPTQLTLTRAWSGTGPMLETAGLDPTVSATLSNVLQEGVLPGGEAADAIQIGPTRPILRSWSAGTAAPRAAGSRPPLAARDRPRSRQARLPLIAPPAEFRPLAGLTNSLDAFRPEGSFGTLRIRASSRYRLRRACSPVESLEIPWRISARRETRPTFPRLVRRAPGAVQVQRRLRSAVPLKIPCSGSGAHSFSPEFGVLP